MSLVALVYIYTVLSVDSLSFFHERQLQLRSLFLPNLKQNCNNAKCLLAQEQERLLFSNLWQRIYHEHCPVPLEGLRILQ